MVKDFWLEGEEYEKYYRLKKCVYSLEKKEVLSIWDGIMLGNGWWERD